MKVIEQGITHQQAASLHASRCIAWHIGLLSSVKTRQISDEVILQRVNDYFLYGLVAIAILRNPESNDFRRSVAKLVLDCINPRWRNSSTEEILGASAISRSDPAVTSWRRAVLERDGFECKNCGAINKLEAHHIVRWADEPMLRVSVGNGITLCEDCHRDEHAK